MTDLNVMMKEEVRSEVMKAGKFYILDENQQFVHGNSIKKLSATEYIYGSSPIPEIAYTDESRAEIQLLQLQIANKFAKMSHTFTLIGGEEKKQYVVMDNKGNYVDCSSIIPMEIKGSKDMEWWYYSYTTPHTSGLLRYHSINKCNKILEGLNLLIKYAGFENIELRIVEVLKDNLKQAEDVVVKIPMIKGIKTKSLKFRNQILRDYMC